MAFASWLCLAFGIISAEGMRSSYLQEQTWRFSGIQDLFQQKQIVALATTIIQLETLQMRNLKIINPKIYK